MFSPAASLALLLTGLALCSAQFSVGHTSADVQRDCQGQYYQDELFVVRLDNVKGDVSSRICYDDQRSTVVTLDCNWNEGQFNVIINSSRDSSLQRTLKTQPPPVNRAANRMQKAAYVPANCNSWDTSQNWRDSFAYDRQKVSIVDGKLYYKTTVYLKEYLYTPSCQYVSPKDVKIELSCCADPQPLEFGPVVPVLNIFRDECKLHDCDGTQNAKCDCKHVGKDLQVDVAYLPPLSSNYDFQLVKLTTSISGTQVGLFPAMIDELSLGSCPARPGLGSSKNAVQRYALRNFGYTGYPIHKQITLECQIQICTRPGGIPTPSRPLCEKQLPPRDPQISCA